MSKRDMLVGAMALMLALAGCGGGAGDATDAATDELTEVTDGSTAVAKDDDDEDTGDAVAYDGNENTEIEYLAARMASRAAAEAEGKTVLVGTVHMIDGPDIFAYEGIDAETLGGADSENGNTYAILELDETATVSGMGADGSPRSGEEVDHIGLGDDLPAYDFAEDTASQWRAYEGKRICVAGDVWFPTDVSFPLSGRMSDAEVLYED